MAGDILTVILWLSLLFGLHISLFPLFRSVACRVAMPLSLSIGVLLFTLLSFWVTLCNGPVSLSLLPFAILVVIACYREYLAGKILFFRSWGLLLSENWRYYALFFIVFGAMLLLRVYSPDISSAEKFMDHGFISSMMRNPQIPPLDPWFAGGDLSVYYYLGHWMLASMGLITGVPSTIVFTLALPTIAAISAVSMYGAGHLILSRFRLLSVVFFFLMNPAFIHLSLSGKEWASLLWDSTRVIEGTINEYPLFSFIFGDVHAHVLGILPQTTLILLITLAVTCWKRLNPISRIIVIFSTALALGAVPPTNSWDILIQAPLVVVTGGILLFCSVKDALPDGQT